MIDLAAGQGVERRGRLADGRRRRRQVWRQVGRGRAGASSTSARARRWSFQPLTGRTHQIRVHAREGLGVGIVGDRVYGYPGGEMLLHASRLVVPRGSKPTIDVTAPLPERFGEWDLGSIGDDA